MPIDKELLESIYAETEMPRDTVDCEIIPTKEIVCISDLWNGMEPEERKEVLEAYISGDDEEETIVLARQSWDDLPDEVKHCIIDHILTVLEFLNMTEEETFVTKE